MRFPAWLLSMCIGAAFLVIYVASLPASGATPHEVDGAYHEAQQVRQIDSLEVSVEVNEPLVLNLPDTLNGAPVRDYRPDYVPAMSWTVGTAFYWRPGEDAAGEHRLTFSVDRVDAPDGTLLLIVDVIAE